MIIKMDFLKRALSIAAAVLFGATLIFIVTSDYGQIIEPIVDRNPAAAISAMAILLLVTQIFAPVSGLPIFLLIARYGSMEIAFIVLGGCYLISSAVNFYIARRFGIRAVKWLVGEKASGALQGIRLTSPMWLVFASRTVGYYYHDLFSYLWGFVPVKTRDYAIGTVLGTVTSLVVEYAIFMRVDTSDRDQMLFLFFGLSAFGVVSILGWKWFSKRQGDRS